MTKRRFLIILVATVLGSSLAYSLHAQEQRKVSTEDQSSKQAKANSADSDWKNKPDSYWKKKLDPQVYQVTRCAGTERPFSGAYWDNHEPGVYRCSDCGAVLFVSNDKFDSGTGWPSFTKAQKDAVLSKQDFSAGMERDEVICSHCGAHLGHVFDDGPAPTGKRFCINSAALNFEHKKAVK